MPRPTIGITCSVGDIRSGEWDEHAAFSPIAYVRAVQRAGARAILLVADEADAADPQDLLCTIDGVILSGGGSDVAPHRYGQPAHDATAAEEPHRDGFEIALARAAKERDMPLLGICRGMQLINVAYGGSLHQHLPDVLEHDEHRVLPAEFARHDVQIEPGSLAAADAEQGDVTLLRRARERGLEGVAAGLLVGRRRMRLLLVEAGRDVAAAAAEDHAVERVEQLLRVVGILLVGNEQQRPGTGALDRADVGDRAERSVLVPFAGADFADAAGDADGGAGHASPFLPVVLGQRRAQQRQR